MASGTTYMIKRGKLVMDIIPEDHVAARQRCIKEHAGMILVVYHSVLGWDTLDELKAQVLGWETRSYKEAGFHSF